MGRCRIAAALIVAERGFAEKHGLQPWARLVAHGVADGVTLLAGHAGQGVGFPS